METDSAVSSSEEATKQYERLKQGVLAGNADKVRDALSSGLIDADKVQEQYMSCLMLKQAGIVKVFSEAGVKPNLNIFGLSDQNWKFPLLLAVEDENEAMVEALVVGILPEEVQRMQETKSLLHLSVVNPDKDKAYNITKCLLEAGFDPNFGCKRSASLVLEKACSVGHLNVVKLLLSHGADPNGQYLDGEEYDEQLTPLMAAMEGNSNEVAEFLINHKEVDLNKVDNYGRTAIFLHFDSGVGTTDLLKLLLEKGADPNIARSTPDPDSFDYWGDTPLMLAIENDLEDIDILLDHDGIDIHHVCEERTTLTHALVTQRWKIARILLERGADPNVVIDNETPFSYFTNNADPEPMSAEQGFEIIDLLVKHGADIEWCDDEGRSSLTGAFYNSQQSLAFAMILQNCRLGGLHSDQPPGTDNTFIEALDHAHNNYHAICMLITAGFHLVPWPRTYDELLALIGKTRTPRSKDKAALQKISEFIAMYEPPQTLKHLCRLEMRKNIGKPFYPNLEKRIDIPQFIRKYIAFEEEFNHFAKCIAKESEEGSDMQSEEEADEEDEEDEEDEDEEDEDDEEADEEDEDEEDEEADEEDEDAD